MIDILAGLAGLALVSLAVSDIFRALLVPRATTHPLGMSRLVGRSLFPAWQGIANRAASAGRRQSTRASFAPLVMVLSLVAWAALLIMGFGLIFWSLRAGFDPHFVRLGDAVFGAGQAFTTLGLPSAVTGIAARTAVIACALSGLAIVTVVATFLISTQAAFARREAPVYRLETLVPLPATGVGILEAFAREDDASSLASFFEAWTSWAADVALSHRAYPVLAFFRSSDSRCEWLAALGAVLDAASLMDAMVTRAPSGARAGSHAVIAAGARLIADLSRRLLADEFTRPTTVDRALVATWRDRLSSVGYTLVEDERQAAARFSESRARYADNLNGLAERLHIDLGRAA